MMTKIHPHYKPDTNPVADPQAIISANKARFTLLTSRLIRLEYSPNSNFEDRPNQIFWHRKQPLTKYSTKHTEAGLEILTEHLELQYVLGEPFHAETLSIKEKSTGKVWRYGSPDGGNLGGTARTLDNIDGQIALKPGLISRLGWTVVDDTQGLVFNNEGWLVPREAVPGTLDLYFLGYGHSYQDCLSDFSRVANAIPMLPR